MILTLFGATFFFHFVAMSSVWSLDYPTKPITLVASATASGPSDLHARILAEAVTKDLGVPVVVVNKPGLWGALGASFVDEEHRFYYGYCKPEKIGDFYLFGVRRG